MSFTQLTYHIVLRTYRSHPSVNEANERNLYAYILGICTSLNAKLMRIGGMPDHIHMLVSIPPSMAVAEFVRRIKFSTGTWLKENKGNFPMFDGWGEGYAAFTYSMNDIPLVKKYIMNQKEHHRIVTFAEEYKQWLLENGVKEEDLRYADIG